MQKNSTTSHMYAMYRPSNFLEHQMVLSSCEKGTLEVIASLVTAFFLYFSSHGAMLGGARSIYLYHAESKEYHVPMP